jgi:hypothetical protein
MSSLASEVAVANLALTGLGADRIISLTEETENARKVNAIFDLMRDEVLRSHPWNFAIERRQFNQTTNTPLYEYESEFQIPGDVLRIISTELNDDDWVVEGDKVLVNDTDFKCRCIIRITNPVLWDEVFVTCFAARLEAELAYAIADSSTLAKSKYEVYLRKLSQAKGIDAQEGTPREMTADEWLTSRFIGTRTPLAR